MPYLGDYIGHLLSEMTIARMHADLEAVRVAELYASHPLLRHMPVPHFRLPELDVDVPVLIKQVEEQKPDAPPRGGIKMAEVPKIFGRILEQRFAAEGIVMKPEHRKTLQSMIEARSIGLGQPTETSVDVHRIADDLATAAARFLRDTTLSGEPADSARMQDFQKQLQDAARLELLKQRQPPPRLNVLVTTQEIREAGPAENVTRIKLKITEQAVEWTTVESEGRTQNRLVPE